MSINFLHSCNFVCVKLLLNQRSLPCNDNEGNQWDFCFTPCDPFKVDAPVFPLKPINCFAGFGKTNKMKKKF